MIISDDKTIAQIQEEFTEKFEGLKLEFYGHAHGTFENSSKKDLLPSDSLIKDIRKIHTEEDYTILPEMTVSSLEQTFEDKFGLHVQVFRRSKDLWLQTSTTDGWTLEVQNRKGIHSNNPEASIYQKD